MKARSLTIGAALAAVVSLSAAVPAVADDDDMFTQIFSAIGLSSPDREPIEYRERAPLVVPPKNQLPAPQAPTGPRNAAWPNDPDVAARRQARTDRNTPVQSRIGKNDTDLMTPGQLRGGPRTASNAYQGLPLGARNVNSNSEELIGPTRQMNAIDANRAMSLNNLRPGEEPERKSLSDPPRGYRQPTEIVRVQQEPVKTKNDKESDIYLPRRN